MGPYNPQYPTPPYYGNYGIQQNFTVDIPQELSGQKAVLSVVHFALLGVSSALMHQHLPELTLVSLQASPEVLFEVVNATVNVA